MAPVMPKLLRLIRSQRSLYFTAVLSHLRLTRQQDVITILSGLHKSFALRVDVVLQILQGFLVADDSGSDIENVYFTSTQASFLMIREIKTCDTPCFFANSACDMDLQERMSTTCLLVSFEFGCRSPLSAFLNPDR